MRAVPEQRPGAEISRVEVEGIAYAVRFRGFDQALELMDPPGARLRPWTLAAHLGALDQHVHPGEGGYALDEERFCAAVLGGIAADHQRALQPLALWWATCGGGRPVAEGEWTRCGPVRARLRPWTLFERSRALSAATRQQPGGGTEFSLGRYLLEMARTSIVATEPALALDDLPGAALLVEALVARNVPEPEADVGDQHLVEVTIRLCQVLGWTPEKVWSTPAGEVDRILMLLERAERGTARPVQRRRGLADDPDAVVIRVEDD